MLSAHQLTRKFLLVASLLTIAVALIAQLAVPATAQGTSSLLLEPSSSSVEFEKNLTVTVYSNSGNHPLVGATVKLKYDASKLQYVTNSINSTGGAFVSPAPANGGGNGTVTMEFFSLPPTPAATGKAKIASVTFKALAQSGSTTITFDNSSGLVSGENAQNVWNGNTTGGTFSFTPKPTNTDNPTNNPSDPNPAQPSNPSNPGNPSQPTDPGDTPDDTPPENNNEQPNDSDPEEEAKQLYMVAVKVSDREDRPVEGAEVELGGNKTTSDIEGIAGFFNIEPGVHEVKIKSKAGVLSTTITVDGSESTASVQTFDLRVEPKERPAWLTAVLGVVVVGLIGTAAFIVISRFRGSKPPTISNNGSSGTNPPGTSNPLDNISGPAAPPPGSVINAG